MHLAMIGSGYVGLVSVPADFGHHVVCRRLKTQTKSGRTTPASARILSPDWTI